MVTVVRIAGVESICEMGNPVSSAASSPTEEQAQKRKMFQMKISLFPTGCEFEKLHPKLKKNIAFRFRTFLHLTLA